MIEAEYRSASRTGFDAVASKEFFAVMPARNVVRATLGGRRTAPQDKPTVATSLRSALVTKARGPAAALSRQRIDADHGAQKGEARPDATHQERRR